MTPIEKVVEAIDDLIKARVSEALARCSASDHYTGLHEALEVQKASEHLAEALSAMTKPAA